MDPTWDGRVSDYVALGLSSNRTISVSCLCDYLDLALGRAVRRQEQPRGATMASAGTICLSAIGIRKADPHSDLGALLFGEAAGGLAPASRTSGAVGAPGAAPYPEAARSRKRVELRGSLCRDVADGGHEVESLGCHPFVFADALPFRLGDHVGIIA